jgi:hypothetical protein
MQKIMNPPEAALRWPWNAEDIAWHSDEERFTPQPLWKKLPLWMILVWLVGVVIFFGLWEAADHGLYQHNLSSQASWIAQASQQEATCLQHATNDAQRAACAHQLASATLAHQAQFDSSHIALGGHDSAAAMHSAFDALYAAACYDPTTGGANLQCLTKTAPALRAWAVQDADNAARG